MRLLFSGLLSLSVVSCFAQDTIRTFLVGETQVRLVMHQSDKSGPLYYNMHDDEHTSVEAAMEIVDEYGGTLYEVVHSGERYVKFSVDSSRYEIDPNRIYTDAGIWRELRRIALRDSLLLLDSLRALDLIALNAKRDSLIQNDDSLLYQLLSTQDSRAVTYVVLEDSMLTLRLPLSKLFFDGRDTLAFWMTRVFADTLLSLMRIDSQDLVVALHNNAQDGYGLGSYHLDNIYQYEALATYRGLHPDFDDFYFVTERRIFEALQPNQYHIVLQDNQRMTDDGSLSVYCGLRGIHYVNVEAQHKHITEQVEMMKILLERLNR